MAAVPVGDEQDDDVIALLDPITRLPARGLFLDRCAIALARARRARASVGVIVVSSDELDHADASARDMLRRRVTVAVTSVVRADDTVARFDDRFVVVCNDVRNDKDLATIATRLTNVLRHRGVQAVSTLLEATATPTELVELVEAG